MPTDPVAAVTELAKAIQWESAARTFGSFHNTLIGLVVEAWTRPRPGKDRYALEGAPKIDGYKSDAVLVEGTEPVGVVEVEGSHILQRIERYKKYLASTELKQPAFGLVLSYATAKKRSHDHYNDGKHVVEDEIFAAARTVIKHNSPNPLMVILVDKLYGEKMYPEFALRSRATYAQGIVSKVEGRLFYRESETPFLFSLVSDPGRGGPVG